MKKRFILLFVFCCCIICISDTAYAAKRIGQATYTDIVTYVNHFPISTYDINGQTAIVAEDLQYYGFDIQYQNEYRLLDIKYSSGWGSANHIPKQDIKPSGSFAANIYQTDITTRFEGKEITSYNIGGKTMIPMDALEKYGKTIWYPEGKKLYFTYTPSSEYTSGWTLGPPKDFDSDISKNISDFTLEMTRDEAGRFILEGENYQYFHTLHFDGDEESTRFEISITQFGLSKAAEVSGLLHRMTNTERGEWITDDTTFANEHMKISINGEPVSILYVTGLSGNNHVDFYFSLDKQFKTLEEIQSIRVQLIP